MIASRALVMRMVRDEPFSNPVAREQTPGVPRVLRQHRVRRAEHAKRAERDVFYVSDRRAHQVQAGRQRRIRIRIRMRVGAARRGLASGAGDGSNRRRVRVDVAPVPVVENVVFVFFFVVRVVRNGILLLPPLLYVPEVVRVARRLRRARAAPRPGLAERCLLYTSPSPRDS